MLAFGCQARVGKSTAVEYLLKNYGGKEFSFAAPLYDILYFAQDRCGIERHKDRDFLQWIGTDWGRKQDENIWVNILLRDAIKQYNYGNVYISDVRFPNEFEALKKEGFILIKLVRESRELNETQKKHASETALDEEDRWDYVIKNDGTKEELFEQLDKIVQKYRK